MDDLISKQVAIDVMCAACWDWCDEGVCKRVSAIQEVQPERKTGNWTRISMDKYTRHAQAWYRCSECQEEFIGKWNYCPNCGSYNRGEQDE